MLPGAVGRCGGAHAVLCAIRRKIRREGDEEGGMRGRHEERQGGKGQGEVEAGREARMKVGRGQTGK